MVTLSSRTIGTLLGYSPFQTPWECFLEKVTKNCKFSTNAAMSHGIKYENEAVQLYTLSTKNKVDLPNNIFKHKDNNWMTGKVDGIVNLKDGKKAILEVKCPYRKKWPDVQKEWNVDKFYWCQVQLYMEILNLDSTHFVEYYRHPEKLQSGESLFRWKTINRDTNWFNSQFPKIEKYYKEICLYSEIGIDRHPVYKSIKEWEDKKNFI